MHQAVRSQFTVGTDTEWTSLSNRRGSSAKIVAKKNSKSYSLRRVMELKDLELGTGRIAAAVAWSKKEHFNPRITEFRTYRS